MQNFLIQFRESILLGILSLALVFPNPGFAQKEQPVPKLKEIISEEGQTAS